VFNQPAGHLEAGETLQQAAVREALEESAWQVELKSFVGLYQYIAPENAECYIRCCFTADAISHDPHRALDPEIIGTHWFSVDDLAQRQSQLRSPAVLQVIRDFLAGHQYPLTLVQTV
jgi:8-oxo-dGTP pyrophosphatase MutT (NUDIX family)